MKDAVAPLSPWPPCPFLRARAQGIPCAFACRAINSRPSCGEAEQQEPGIFMVPATAASFTAEGNGIHTLLHMGTVVVVTALEEVLTGGKE